MREVTWDASFETGNEMVDEQHRSSLVMINELRMAIADREPIAVQEDILGRVIDHLTAHFTDEEALMLSVGYPGRRDQRHLHKDFLAQVGALWREYASGDHPLPITLEQFIYTWLVNHIRTEDRAMAEYVREHS